MLVEVGQAGGEGAKAVGGGERGHGASAADGQAKVLGSCTNDRAGGGERLGEMGGLAATAARK